MKSSSTGLDSDSIENGAMAPDFELSANDGSRWKLSDQIGNVVALLFYPGNETLVCTKQLCSVRDNWKEYLETKATVVGISPGGSIDNDAMASKYELPFPLLEDSDRAVTTIFGFHWILPITLVRAIVIVDAHGVIRSRQSMFRAFKPTDRSVIRSIYSARSDALTEKYQSLKNNLDL